MRRILAALCALMLVFGITGCAAGNKLPDIPDYSDVSEFEADLNAGHDMIGKTVTITVDKLVPDSAFGYNIQTGEHLNFCSADNPKVSVGDVLTVRVDDVAVFLHSYIIGYTVIEYVKKTMPAVTTTPQTTAPKTTSPPITSVTETSVDEFDGISPASGIMYVKDNVNVRKGPGTEFGRVGHLNKGEKVEITGKSENGWYRIKFNDGEYFVSENYLTEEQPAQSSASTETSSIATTAKPETTSPPTTKAPETAPSTTTQKRLTEDDIRPEFKELMDQYEAFFDDYIAFMKKYMNASSDDPMAMLGMLQDYLDWLEKYSEVMEDFEDVGDSDLTRAETLYYAEVALRIEQKLLSVMY